MRLAGLASMTKIRLINGRFASSQTEAAYQAHVFERHLKSNIWSTMLALLLFVAYTPSDFVDSAKPMQSVAVRLSIFFCGAGLLSLLAHKKIAPYYDAICTTIVALIGVGFIINIGLQPTLNNTYYIGIIQGIIFFSLLLRLHFLSTAIALSTSFTGFIFVAFSKGDNTAAALQTANVAMVAITCLAGVYFLQRYQRADFVKSQIIQQQNDKLTELLADARRDQNRKLAALNMLLHMVRTPIHQISGFTDIMLSKLSTAANDSEDQIGSECLDSANYIKAASDSLRQNVSKLLSYHKLDELERSAAPEEIELEDFLWDHTALIEEDIDISIDCDVTSLTVDRRILQTAIDHLVNNFEHHKEEISTLSINARANQDNIAITFKDDGPGIDAEKFKSAIKPLNEIENYLNGDGSSPTMGLRSVARVMEIAAGRFEYTYDNGSLFSITFPSNPPIARKEHTLAREIEEQSAQPLSKEGLAA